MSKSFETEGTLKVIGGIQSFDSGFTKREFVVEVHDGKYPQMVKFECVKERTSLTNGMKLEDPVKVSFDIRGNEYNGKYYVNLQAWNLERLEDDARHVEPAAQESPQPTTEHVPTAPVAHAKAHATEDEIPF